jgi:hypothetical protein
MPCLVGTENMRQQEQAEAEEPIGKGYEVEEGVKAQQPEVPEQSLKPDILRLVSAGACSTRQTQISLRPPVCPTAEWRCACCRALLRHVAPKAKCKAASGPGFVFWAKSKPCAFTGDLPPPYGKAAMPPAGYRLFMHAPPACMYYLGTVRYKRLIQTCSPANRVDGHFVTITSLMGKIWFSIPFCWFAEL